MAIGTTQVIVSLLLALCLCTHIKAQLLVGFYKNKCPNAESIVKDVVFSASKAHGDTAADLVRLQFHDCFVRGCDGSVLLDSTARNVAEKDAPPNKNSLEGFDVIDAAKSKLEAACPGVVSCADIVVFAARDGVELANGGRYEVPSGRRDGRVSLSAEAVANLPSPTENLQQLTSRFANKGLTQEDLVLLTGAHTLGSARCSKFQNRLYNFSATVKTDPSLDPAFAAQLKRKCPPGSPEDVPMDPKTPNVVDNNHYQNILSHKVVFTSDQTLLSAPGTSQKVNLYANSQLLFKKDFATAMVKMSKIGILTGANGEIRRKCRIVN